VTFGTGEVDIGTSQDELLGQNKVTFWDTEM
jgi:hypothetical protein